MIQNYDNKRLRSTFWYDVLEKWIFENFRISTMRSMLVTFLTFFDCKIFSENYGNSKGFTDPTAWGFILRASTSRLGFYSVFIFFPSKNFLRLLHTANHILNIGTVPFLPSANFVPFLQFFAGSVSIFRDYPWINSLFMKIVSILSRYC